MTIEEVNHLSRAAFVSRFGHLFEHSPWVVEQAETHRPFRDEESMLNSIRAAVERAGGDPQLALLCAHPELAGKAAIDASLTTASAAEQASAGLDRLTAEEFALFHERNGAYRQRFGFPFIICVRLTNKAGILDAMKRRLANERATEFACALDEVFKIAGLRLKEALA